MSRHAIAHHRLLRVVKHVSDTSRNLINKLISNDAILAFFFFLYIFLLSILKISALYSCTTVYGMDIEIPLFIYWESPYAYTVYEYS